MTGHVVIGANYGDEGKGLVTDYLVRQHGSRLVVRFNGGAQAGHTVRTPDGREHVFHHFGAGTLATASTFLSKHFLCNPLMFKVERDRLAADYDPASLIVFADSRAPVTTPVDMIINQFVENARDGSRHGSCGVGINETVTRTLKGAHPLHVADIFGWSDERLTGFMHDVIFSHGPARLLELGYDDAAKRYAEIALAEADGMISVFLDAVAYFKRHVRFISHPSHLLLTHRQDVVFEGAQGLGLDENLGKFPHVTRSLCGLPNALDVASEMGVSTLEAWYVSRAYLTRHGAGPLEGEDPTYSFDDMTNVEHEFQGKLRFAPLDVVTLNERINADLARARDSSIKVTPSFVLTCLDQVARGGHKVRVNQDGFRLKFDTTDLLPFILDNLDAPMRHVFTSRGPSATDLRIEERASRCDEESYSLYNAKLPREIHPSLL